MKISCGILGATGVIGQHYVSLLENHPLFKMSWLADSTTSIEDLQPCDLIFSALPNHLAQVYEPRFAKAGCTVISSASCHRESSPLIIPEINSHCIGKSKLISKPNCAIQSFMLPLAPLHKKAKIRALSVTTLQAISGAGNSGLTSCAIHDNIIPYIEGEESKLESEPLKILEAHFPISAQCNRVPVMHGHLACVSVSFEENLTKEEILALWREPSPLSLPSAPKYPVIYHESPHRPQTRLDRDLEGGMAVSVGRLRPCPIFDWRFVALSHNAVRGGAGGGILIGELLHG